MTTSDPYIKGIPDHVEIEEMTEGELRDRMNDLARSAHSANNRIREQASVIESYRYHVAAHRTDEMYRMVAEALESGPYDWSADLVWSPSEKASGIMDSHVSGISLVTYRNGDKYRWTLTIDPT